MPTVDTDTATKCPIVLAQTTLASAPELMRRTVDLLNELLRLDPNAMNALFSQEVPVSTALLDSDLLVVVTVGNPSTPDVAVIGPLGVIGGIVNTERYRIDREMDACNNLIGFGVFEVIDVGAAGVET